MAEKMMKYYKYIVDEKGLQGKVQLASLTKIPSIIAGTMPDTPENLKKFEKAIEEITEKPLPKWL